MNRNITGKGIIKGPKHQKSHEREFSEIMVYMVEQITKRFRNGVFNELNQNTIDKFSDAQIGNYAKIFLYLANQTRKKILSQFNNDRIAELTEKYLSKTTKRNRDLLYKQVEDSIGISTKELTSTEGLTSQLNALHLATQQWVQKLRDDTLEMYTNNSLQAMITGASLGDILNQFDGLAEKRKNHAKFTARNQITNFNSISTKLRAQNLGIEEAIWRTSEDERVRKCHKERDGKKFKLSEGLYSSCDGKTLLPGVDYQCRCTYDLVIPEE